MHKARSFFFVCAGIFLLALAFHFGAMTATAQAPGNSIVASNATGDLVFTANGDMYLNIAGNPGYANWQRERNVFTNSGPTPAAQSTWGQVKSRYLPDGTAKPSQDK